MPLLSQSPAFNFGCLEPQVFCLCPRSRLRHLLCPLGSCHQSHFHTILSSGSSSSVFCYSADLRSPVSKDFCMKVHITGKASLTLLPATQTELLHLLLRAYRVFLILNCSSLSLKPACFWLCPHSEFRLFSNRFGSFFPPCHSCIKCNWSSSSSVLSTESN